MKFTLQLLIILFSHNLLFSQLTVTHDSLQLVMTDDNYSHLVGHSTIKNTYDHEITILWQKGDVCNGEDWSYAICDKNTCYFPTTLEKEVILGAGDTTNIDIHFNNFPTDFAILHTKITNLNDPSETIDIKYFINATDCTGTPLGTNLLENEQLRLFPNPVADKLHIENSSANEAFIFDITGRLISTQMINRNTIDTGFLKDGTYQLSLRNKEGRILASKIFIKQ